MNQLPSLKTTTVAALAAVAVTTFLSPAFADDLLRAGEVSLSESAGGKQSGGGLSGLILNQADIPGLPDSINGGLSTNAGALDASMYPESGRCVCIHPYYWSRWASVTQAGTTYGYERKFVSPATKWGNGSTYKVFESQTKGWCKANDEGIDELVEWGKRNGYDMRFSKSSAPSYVLKPAAEGFRYVWQPAVTFSRVQNQTRPAPRGPDGTYYDMRYSGEDDGVEMGTFCTWFRYKQQTY